MPNGVRRDIQHLERDREFAEEVNKIISVHLMDSVLPHLELVQNEVSMSTGLLNELINVLEQNDVISSKQREEIYLKARAKVPYLLLEHLRNLDCMNEERRQFNERHAKGSA
jgi:hypothetical protein